MPTPPADATAPPTTRELLRRLEAHLADAEAGLSGVGAAGERARDALARARGILEQLHADRGAPAPGPAVVRRVKLPPRAQSAQQARAFTLESCQQWALPPQVVNAATDLASELVANAVAHSTAMVVLALERGAGSLLVRVWDDGAGLPRLLPYRPGVSERGLGLRLVRQLSTHWGVAEESEGKWVWARVALDEPL